MLQDLTTSGYTHVQEIVEMFRKVMLVGVISFFYPGSTSQLLVGILLGEISVGRS